MVQISMGTDGYVPNERWRVWLPSRISGPCRAIVACHGGGGEERMMDRDWHPQLHDNMIEIVERSGFAVLIPDHTTTQEPTGAHTWGNDDSTDAILAMLTWARTKWHISEDPAVMWGGSMGHVTAWAFAQRFPEEVAAIIGVAGASSLDYHHQGNDGSQGWYQAEIDSAHDAADYTTVIKPKADPMVIATNFSLPWLGWWGDSDPVARLSEAQTFQSIVGGDLHVVSGGDHASTFGGTTPDLFVDFLAAL